MSKPSCMDYMPAGPLLDITVTAGEMEEVYLPHWIGEQTYMCDENCSSVLIIYIDE